MATDALGHGARLGLAELVAERVDLPVDVRFRDHVQVDQRDRPIRRARQRFGRPGADAADADDADVGVLETRSASAP
jgi:hypothetical protein